MTDGVREDTAEWAARPRGKRDVASTDPLFDGPGEMRARCRAVDWARTPLGPSQAWPAALRTGVRLMLAAPVATSLWCGPGYTLLYNDTYHRILGVKHPGALGRSGADVWTSCGRTWSPSSPACGPAAAPYTRTSRCCGWSGWRAAAWTTPGSPTP